MTYISRHIIFLFLFYTDDGLDDWGKMLCRRREGRDAVDLEACMQAYYGKQKRKHAVADTPTLNILFT